MEISGTTRLTALLGHPVAHSISPAMHNMAFDLLGLDYRYLALDVLPENLGSAVIGLKNCGIRGFNLTMPHKVAVIEYMDELTIASKLTGAVNTVINEDGHLVGHTTDGIGYMQSLKDAGFDIIGKNMTMLGAGGAAKAICAQAALDGVKKIYMFEQERFMKPALEFAAGITNETDCEVVVSDIADRSCLKSSIEDSALINNATNVGMEPDTDNALIEDFSEYDPELIVTDIIYHPRQTKMLKAAKASGHPTMNGMYMLLYQGAASFECWTGCEMPAEKIKNELFV